MKSKPRLPIALIGVGSVLMITGSIVGLVSGSPFLLVGMTGFVGAMCLAISMYLYRQLDGPPSDDS